MVAVHCDRWCWHGELVVIIAGYLSAFAALEGLDESNFGGVAGGDRSLVLRLRVLSLALLGTCVNHGE